MADDLSKAAIGLVHIGILFPLVFLPTRRGHGGKPHVQRKQQREQDGQRPVVNAHDDQHRDGLNQHGEEVVGEGLHELRDIGDRAIQPGDDGAGDLIVVVGLRHGKQLGKVASGQDLTQARHHDVADIAADVFNQVAQGVGSKQCDDEPHDGAQGAFGRGVALQGLNDGVGCLADQEGRDEREHRGHRGGGKHSQIKRPQRRSTASNAQDGIHKAS